MKRLLLLGLVLLASPAAAAPPPAWATLSAREARTGARIDQAARSGQITAAEAARLRQKLHRIESLRAYYRKSHGMSAWERRDLEGRLKTLDAHIAKDREARAHAREARDYILSRPSSTVTALPARITRSPRSSHSRSPPRPG